MRADLALLPLGTLAHALTNDDVLRWLAAVGNALRPGGLLVLELPHPADVFDGALVEVRPSTVAHSITHLQMQAWFASTGCMRKILQALLTPFACGLFYSCAQLASCS